MTFIELDELAKNVDGNLIEITDEESQFFSGIELALKTERMMKK